MQKKSETLKQREKAQKDLLELKKMQQGLIDQPIEEDNGYIRTPQTLMEKKDNFFYHHKVAFYAVVLLVVVFGFLIFDAATKVKYDTTVVLFTHELYPSSRTEILTEFFKENSEDVDKNGKINISIYDCSYNDDTAGYEYQKTQRGKVQTRLMAGNAMLFLLDEVTLNDLRENLDYELFKEENIIDITEIFDGNNEEKGTYYPKERLLLCLREIEGSLAEGKTEDYNNAKVCFEKIKASIK